MSTQMVKVGVFVVAGAIGVAGLALFVARNAPAEPASRAKAASGPASTVERLPEEPPEPWSGRRVSRVVEGVSFSFRKPTPSWAAGPIERRGGGFRSGSLYVSRSSWGPQGAEGIVFWTTFPDGKHADPCTELLSPTLDSVAELARAVAAAPGTDLVSGPSKVTVGGRPAKHVVFTVRKDVGCDPGFFYSWHDEMWGAFWPGTSAGNSKPRPQTLVSTVRCRRSSSRSASTCPPETAL
jgi:hypothetical protein